METVTLDTVKWKVIGGRGDQKTIFYVNVFLFSFLPPGVLFIAFFSYQSIYSPCKEANCTQLTGHNELLEVACHESSTDSFQEQTGTPVVL